MKAKIKQLVEAVAKDAKKQECFWCVQNKRWQVKSLMNMVES